MKQHNKNQLGVCVLILQGASLVLAVLGYWNFGFLVAQMSIGLLWMIAD